MKHLALVALVACSKPAPPVPIDVATFISPDVVSVLRGTGTDFPIVGYFTTLLSPPPPCWTKLRSAITAGYQFEIKGGGSYFILDGDLPKAEVEACVTTALADTLAVKVAQDGELDTFTSDKAGTAYVAWRGNLVITGTKARVTTALAPGAPELARTWHARIAQLPTAPMAMWRADQLLHNLFGVPTTSYQLVFDRVSKTPKPTFAGRLVVQYATAGEAAAAAQKIQQGLLEPQIGAPPELAAAFQRMKVSQTDAAVETRFDSDTVAGLDLATMQSWLGRLAARP